jgi:2-polyprenyl-3-methyl-5-hydroxy-6-metoxy-1,4-benzoquinol methylase
MTDFFLQNRSYEAELLDAEHIPQDLLFQNLQELDIVNHYLGGHAISFAGLEQLLPKKIDQTISIVDIGCGSGDTLLQIAKWAMQKGISVQLLGVDLKADVIIYAKEHCKKFANIQFIETDYTELQKYLPQMPDIFICSLFCHHLTEKQLVTLFKFMQEHSKIGFIINDLQRHLLAYWGIKFLTTIFRGSSLVRNDAPLSVWRGFHYKELLQILQEANISKFDLRWKWAFRYLLVCKK